MDAAMKGNPKSEVARSNLPDAICEPKIPPRNARDHTPENTTRMYAAPERVEAPMTTSSPRLYQVPGGFTRVSRIPGRANPPPARHGRNRIQDNGWRGDASS